MYQWKSFPQVERELRAYHYKPFYNSSDEAVIASQLCPACNINLHYIGYKNAHGYKAFMYCNGCRYWEQY